MIRDEIDEKIDEMNDDEIDEEIIRVKKLMLEHKTNYNDIGQSEMDLVRRTAWAWTINGYNWKDFVSHLDDFAEVITCFEEGHKLC